MMLMKIIEKNDDDHNDGSRSNNHDNIQSINDKSDNTSNRRSKNNDSNEDMATKNEGTRNNKIEALVILMMMIKNLIKMISTLMHRVIITKLMKKMIAMFTIITTITNLR